jgi:hypothetical protein
MHPSSHTPSIGLLSQVEQEIINRIIPEKVKGLI